MKFLLAAAWAAALLALSAGIALAAYTPGLSGQVAGFRLAGIEPDGDPLNQVVLQTRLSAGGGHPALNLIVSSYLENFQPDTTPVLPDLLHPTRTATNLGGFLQGKGLITDDAGNVLYIGSFLAEAFLDNTNHVVMKLYGSGNAYGGRAVLKGSFRLAKSGTLHGALSGSVVLPAAARAQVLRNRGAKMKDLKKIISVVTVRPAPMMGRAKTGNPNAPLHTGYGKAPKKSPTSSSHKSTPWFLMAGAGIVALLAAAVFLYLALSDGKQGRPRNSG